MHSYAPIVNRSSAIYRFGLGQATPTLGQQATVGTVLGSQVGLTTALSTGSATEGAIAGGLALAGAFVPVAGPFIEALAGLVGPIASLFKGCGSTCTQATQYANQAVSVIEQAFAQYWAQPVRYASSQQAYLNAFDQIWGWMQQACGNPQLGAAGEACISERARGGASTWCCNSNGQWNYGPKTVTTTITNVGNGKCVGCDMFVTLRDPVAQDTGVQPDPVPGAVATAAGGDVLSTITGGTGGSWLIPLLLVGAGAFFFMSGV
jgi:hypothetical protein